MANTKAKKEPVRMVKVFLPKLRDSKDQDVPVGVNGETFLIKRGVEVEVPYYVKAVLDAKEKALDEAEAFIASAVTAD